MKLALVGWDSSWRTTLTGATFASSATTNLDLIRVMNICTLSAMLHGWHFVVSTYGFWLPNDPRGSGSARVRAQHIYDAGGAATKVNTTHSVAHRQHNVQLRRMAKEALKYPPESLTGLQARAVGRGISAIVPKVALTIHACAILRDHVHVVAAAHKFGGDEIMACLKRAGTRGMNEEGLHPLQAFSRQSGKHPSPWAAGGWKVMLFTAEHVQAAIRYVEGNPVRAGLRQQT